MSVHYLPDLTGITPEQPFRFWCQKVLPLVYDDSLSYYELLCKVVNYLNNTMQDVNTLAGDVSAIATAYTQLETYVNEYFDNLDVQEEINAKLDAMAQDGSLSALVAEIIPDIVTDWLDEHVIPYATPIDKTLTIENAAADAKVTGDQLNLRVKVETTQYSGDLDTIETNSFYYVDESAENLPPISGDYYVKTVIYLGTNTLAGAQFATHFASGISFYRQKTNGTWGNWQTRNLQVLRNADVLDCDDADINSYFYSETADHLPVSNKGFYVETILYNGDSTAACFQLAIQNLTGDIFYRKKISNVWSDWNGITLGMIKSREAVTAGDADTLLENGFVYCDSTTANLPGSGGYFIETVLYNVNDNRSAIQNAYHFPSGKRYYRRRSNSNWESWVDTGTLYIESAPVFSGTDVNTILENSIKYVAAGTTNLPTAEDGYFLQTVLYDGSNTASAIQLAYNFPTGKQYYRRRTLSSWGAWQDLLAACVFNTAAMASDADLNDITVNGWTYASGTQGHIPTALTGAYYVNTIFYNISNQAACIQNAYHNNSGARFTRRKVNNSWSGWTLSGGQHNDCEYQAFGDSITYGSIWVPIETSPYYNIQRVNILNQMPTRIANACGCLGHFTNNGVGGAYFVGSGDNKIINAIQAANISNCRLITVGGGRNDSENTLGDKTSATGSNTICGAIKEIIEYIITQAPKCQIVWYGVTPNTSDNSTVFTRVFAGGWSLNTFDEKVSELCAEYGVPYIDWKQCRVIRKWADYSGAGNVWSHPNDSSIYVQMGNYLGGRIAQFYSN